MRNKDTIHAYKGYGLSFNFLSNLINDFLSYGPVTALLFIILDDKINIKLISSFIYRSTFYSNLSEQRPIKEKSILESKSKSTNASEDQSLSEYSCEKNKYSDLIYDTVHVKKPKIDNEIKDGSVFGTVNKSAFSCFSIGENASNCESNPSKTVDTKGAQTPSYKPDAASLKIVDKIVHTKPRFAKFVFVLFCVNYNYSIYKLKMYIIV